MELRSGRFLHFFYIYGRAWPGCKKFVKLVFYVELRIDGPPVRFTYRGCRKTLLPDDFGNLAFGVLLGFLAVAVECGEHRSGEGVRLRPSQFGHRALKVRRLKEGARVERAVREVEVRAVGVDLRLGLVDGLEFHCFEWVEVEGKGGLLAEVGLDFLARGDAESLGAGNVALGVVAVENVAALAHADDALDAPEGVVKVEVAGLDLSEGSSIHFVLENRTGAPSLKLFFVFSCRTILVPTAQKKSFGTVFVRLTDQQTRDQQIEDQQIRLG